MTPLRVLGYAAGAALVWFLLEDDGSDDDEDSEPDADLADVVAAVDDAITPES